MDKPQRYWMYLSAPAGGIAQMIADDNKGDWVNHRDYVKLQAENERLRKAGDKMDVYLKRQDGTTNGMLPCRKAWLKAKKERDAK